jgi:hypothetical protein
MNEPSAENNLMLARLQAANEKAARGRVESAIANRNPHGPAQPTGVQLKNRSGKLQAICDDGSIRNLYQRMPGMSGRQFRKLRKLANKHLKHHKAQMAALAKDSGV